MSFKQAFGYWTVWTQGFRFTRVHYIPSKSCLDDIFSRRASRLCDSIPEVMLVLIRRVLKIWVNFSFEVLEQEDLLDLITALLNLTVCLPLQSQRSAHSQAVLDDSFVTVDIAPLDQHKLYYCTISRSRCEISDDVMVLIFVELSSGYVWA